jgi:hypothetical protein
VEFTVQALIVDTLKIWREAERALEVVPPTDPKHESVRKLVIELRALYADLSGAQALSDEVIASKRGRVEDAREELRVLLDGA